MDWRICETPVRYMAEQAGALGSIMTFEDQKVLSPRPTAKNAIKVAHERASFLTIG